ncbi:MAG: transketolase family protein [Chloroflexi bacterium]|uniref:transketolase family protein n=1 Tax=Candidatus Flexifilum breve TaxID=3140694 RepID=UPI003135CB9A|nr:transketolase family protein [Chloroflexota bacterium]
MEIGKANLDVFAETLLSLAQTDRDILAVTSDSRGSGKLTKFGETLPDQIVEVGIAEQNLVGISAGLASAGKKVFAVSPACFLTARSLEQIKNDVAYSDQRVKVIGISAGVSYGALGSTHHSLHDYAVLRAINNIDIVAPADNFETREVIRAALNHPRPLYIRFGKRNMPHVHAPGTTFEIGKAITLKTGTDVTFIAIGEPVPQAVLAAEKLADEGISAGVISMHTLKPFDTDALLHAAATSRAIITVEEHSVYGGLGERCASILMEKRVMLPFKIVGFPDEYTVTGSQMEIFAHYGISPDGLAATARTLLHAEVTG